MSNKNTEGKVNFFRRKKKEGDKEDRTTLGHHRDYTTDLFEVELSSGGKK